jgi:20S proteasome subunit beta 4
VQRNVALNEFRTGLKASTKSAACYVRSELSTALRRNPYQVNMLIGGWDAAGAGGAAGGAGAAGSGEAASGPSLYFIDYLGSSQKMDYACHGYASYFIFSTLDAHWRAGMSLDDALALARTCIKELATRFMIHQPVFKVKVADANGTREVAL